MSEIALVWFRRDLRLDDNQALACAAQAGSSVIPLFIQEDPEESSAAPSAEESSWSEGAASRSWLHHSLAALGKALETRGSRLIIRKGSARDVLMKAIEETGARRVCWNRLYEPGSVERDKAIKAELSKIGVEAKSFGGYLLKEPWELSNSEGKPFRVFSPFWRALSKAYAVPKVVPLPQTLQPPRQWPESENLDSLGLRPHIPWDRGFYGPWTPGEDGGQRALTQFAREAALHYSDSRNTPSIDGTSRLSPHLHFGEVSPHQVWRTCEHLPWDGVEPYLRQLGWREFAAHLLYHFPFTAERPLRPEFEKFPWRKNHHEVLRSWQQGMTGYPIVDAGMRQLWKTGWMHNRVRMIVASFLVKHLRVHWIEGARWFWDTLVDADLANNTLGWQWVSGCGADAAPYFRVFNPMLQGKKFDPRGTYVREWVPELQELADKWIHAPWEASSRELERAGVVLGRTYPRPLVDHDEGRQAALDAFYSLKGGADAAL